MKRKPVTKHTYVAKDGEGWDLFHHLEEQIKWAKFDVPVRRIGGNSSDEVYIDPIDEEKGIYWSYLDTWPSWEDSTYYIEGDVFSMSGPATEAETEYYYEMIRRYDNCEKMVELKEDYDEI